MGSAHLKEIDSRGETVSLFTPLQAGDLKIIQGGDLYLRREGREPGKAPGYTEPKLEF
jgi:hypothetical protein